MRRFFKKIFNKLTLKNYRKQLIYEQNRTRTIIKQMYEQLFLSNPVLVVQNVKMYLPLFYVDHIQKIIFENREFYEIETLKFLKLHFKEFHHVQRQIHLRFRSTGFLGCFVCANVCTLGTRRRTRGFQSHQRGVIHSAGC